MAWAPRASGDASYLEGVTWGGGQFVAVGYQYVGGSQTGTILTSPDGVTWTPRASGTSHELEGVAWNGHQFVAVGRIILRSVCTAPGDVNGDDGINALDVVAVINQFLGLQTWPAADANSDGTVNALDVVYVINQVLGL